MADIFMSMANQQLCDSPDKPRNEKVRTREAATATPTNCSVRKHAEMGGCELVDGSNEE